jgi:hypothetical protein
MARPAILATIILVLIATGVPGCTGNPTTTSPAPTTTTSPAPTTTTLAATSSSGRSSSTASAAQPTTTAGQTWEAVVKAFTKGVTRANLPGTLPYSMLPGDKVAWLLSSDSPVHPTRAGGFRFANGDLVILFWGSMLAGSGSPDDVEKALSDARKALQKMAEAKCAVPGKSVQASVDDQVFGFIVVAGENADRLRGLAEVARFYPG